MPSYAQLQESNPEQFDQMVDFVASLKEDMPEEGEESGSETPEASK